MVEQLEEGRRFASRDDEAVDFIKVLGIADESDLGTQFLETLAMRVKITL